MTADKVERAFRRHIHGPVNAGGNPDKPPEGAQAVLAIFTPDRSTNGETKIGDVRVLTTFGTATNTEAARMDAAHDLLQIACATLRDQAEFLRREVVN